MGKECCDAEAELARGVARGDSACVATFFNAYHQGLYRYMLCLTGNVEDAEDLAQDSLIQAKSHIRSFRGDSSLKTWVHRVAYHKFTHWSRRRKPRAELTTSLIAKDRHFQQIEAAQALVKALRELGPLLAQPLVLQEINDLSVEEIATILGIPVGTVKSRVFTARQRLRTLLGDQSC